MDGDLGSALNAILSDPAQMEKLSAVAKDLFGQGGEALPAEGISNAADVAGVPAVDTRFMSALGKAFAGGSGGERSRSTALLVAMRPYMKPEKQEKLDRAMQIARMVNIAGAVMREYGGGDGV